MYVTLVLQQLHLKRTKKQTHNFQTSLQFWLIYKNFKSKQLQMA